MKAIKTADFYFFIACSTSIPLGMESGDILDAKITSSPQRSRYGLYNAKFARLNQKAIPDVTNGGWSPTFISNSWLQIDFTASTLGFSLVFLRRKRNPGDLALIFQPISAQNVCRNRNPFCCI